MTYHTDAEWYARLPTLFGAAAALFTNRVSAGLRGRTDGAPVYLPQQGLSPRTGGPR